MEIIKTNKGGEKVCLNGYMYVVHKKSKTTILWKCSKRNSLKCKGSLTTSLEKNNPHVTAEHNHLPNETAVTVTKAVQNMKQRAEDTLARPVQIYAATVASLNDDAKLQMPTEETAKRTLRNHKSKKFPPVPNTLEDLVIEEEWRTTGEPNLERFLLNDNGPNAEERAIIFANDSSLRMLSSSPVWYMDGNFNLAPPYFMQLYVIRIAIRGSFVTAVYSLLQQKTQNTYEHVLRTVLDACEERNLFAEPTTIHVDFEKATIQAIRAILGDDVTIRECFYHLCQSTHRKVQSLGLEAMYRENGELTKFCGMIDGLAFLPLEDVAEGMEYLRQNTPEVAEDILNYFDQTYVTGTFRRHVNNNNGNIRMRVLPPSFPPQTWNVCEATLSGNDRTNNQTEGWNNRFRNLVGYSHPSVWLLITKMREELAVDTTKILQLEAGVPTTKRRRPQYEHLQARLQSLCEEYRDGTRNIPDFLGAISHNIRQRVNLA